MSARRCRVCGSGDLTLRGRKAGAFIRREFEFHACRACGFMFVEPFSGFAIYNDEYYRGHGPDPYVDYETEYRDWRRTDRVMEFQDLVDIAERHLSDGAGSKEQGAGPNPFASGPAPSTLLPAPAARSAAWLDFGCGAGAFLKFLRERGSIAGRRLEVTGHDVGSYADLLKSQDGFRILSLDELSAEAVVASRRDETTREVVDWNTGIGRPDARYDVISMIEVIEHLPDPLEPLQLVARLLKPGGLLLLTTGNLASPIAQRQGIHYRYCAPEIHVSLFNPRCLETAYRRVGLEPVHVRYRGAVKFKVVKTLRHRRLLRALAGLALRFPPIVRLVDALYGVSAMPCAVKPNS